MFPLLKSVSPYLTADTFPCAIVREDYSSDGDAWSRECSRLFLTAFIISPLLYISFITHVVVLMCGSNLPFRFHPRPGQISSFPLGRRWNRWSFRYTWLAANCFCLLERGRVSRGQPTHSPFLFLFLHIWRASLTKSFVKPLSEGATIRLIESPGKPW